MKKVFLIFGLLLFTVNSVNAQFEYEVNTFYEGGYENNIFHSPSSYLDNGIMLDEDSLVHSDIHNGFGWDLQLEKEFGDKHRLRVENDGWLRRYNTFGNANQADLQVEIKYDYDMNNRIDMGGELWGSKSNRMGTNVLGEELTRTFAYREIGSTGYFESDLWNRAVAEIELGWRYRKYKSDPGMESLTYSETGISLDLEQEFGSADAEQFVSLEFEFEDKPYRERTSNDSTGYSGDPIYPKRHWQYFTTTLTYGLEFFRYWSLEPSYQFRHRTDMFQHYFDYNQHEYGAELRYRNGRLDISSDLSYTDRLYTVRTAPQSQGPEPDLNYRYIGYGFEIEYELLSGLFILGDYQGIQRRTNVNLETMRTRRSYDFSVFTLGLSYELNGTID